MKHTSRSDLSQHLDNLGLSRSIESLIVHASMISFGNIHLSAAEIFALISEKIADDATVFVPTFTLNLDAEMAFDVEKTCSQGMGVLSEYVRTQPGATRANNPMHSYAALGPHADVLKSASSTLSFGPDSCFEKMLALDPHLLLLGCPFHHGATHIHQQEASVGVPFRSWIDLKRKLKRPDGAIDVINFQYYGIDHADEVDWSPLCVLKFLQNKNQITEVAAPYGKSYHLNLADLDAAAHSVLKNDSTALNLLA